MTKFFFLALALILASPFEEWLTSYLAASLVRAQDDYRVYYIEGKKRHWIDSPELFKVHALPWEEVEVIPQRELAKYSEGEKITESSTVKLSGEEEKLPDLAVFPARDLSLKENKGQTLLLFSTLTWNMGRGPLELIPGKRTIVDGEEYTDVFHRIYRDNGGYRDKLVGNFYWHDAKGHNHYHFTDFVDYILERVDESGSQHAPTMKEKTSFCVLDEMKVDLGLPGAPRSAQFPKCLRTGQGISVGWGDDYEYDLAGQNFNITDFPAGIYRLTFYANPRNRIVESRDDNNKSFAFFHLDPASKKVEIIAKAAPFAGASSFPNGFLIQSERDGKTYKIHNNKKRLVLSRDAETNEAHILPQSIIDVLPYNNLVRAQDGKVYAINDAGYKRHIRNPDIFSSYNLSWSDVADVSAAELIAHQDSRIIRVDGDPAYYLISGGAPEQVSYLEAFYERGFNKDEVQTINKTDFASYSLASSY